MSKIIKSSDVQPNAYGGFVRDFLVDETEETIVEGFDEPEDEGEPLPDPEEILAAARAEAEEKVREAYAEGMRRGEERGIAAFQERAGDAIAVVEQAIQLIQEQRTQFIASMEPQVVGLVRFMAERLIRREWEQDEATVLRMARESLGAIGDAQRLTIRVHPEDVAIIREHRSELLDGLNQISNVSIAPDETVERGGCLVETEHLVVDGTLQAQLEKILEAL